MEKTYIVAIMNHFEFEGIEFAIIIFFSVEKPKKNNTCWSESQLLSSYYLTNSQSLR